MKEIWKDIPGYEGLYQVSNLGRIKSLYKRKRKNETMILKEKHYDLKGNFIKEFPSLSEAARTLKISAGNIVMCCTGKYKQAKGYIWKYKSEVMPNL